MEKEIWKDINDYEGLYQISSFGRVKTLSRKIRYEHHVTKQEFFRLTKTKIMSLKNVKGYNCVILFKNNSYKNYRVCRLVAIHFIKNKDNKEQVNHIDCNKLNDNVTNLEWTTPLENTRHAIENGLVKIRIGCECKNSKKVKCLKTNKVFETIKEAAEFYGIEKSILSRKLRNIYKNNTNLILLNA